MAADDDLDLRSLDDDELVKQMHDDLYDGLKEERSRRACASCSSAAGRLTTC